MKSNIRVSSSLYKPGGREEHLVEVVKHDVKGLGRWIYCKYCYKSVKPSLSGINQVVCSECGAGLTPDFFKWENLQRYLKTMNKDTTNDNWESIIKDDMSSKEAKEWLEERKLQKEK